MRATVYWSRILLLIIFGRKVNIHLTKSILVLMQVNLTSTSSYQTELYNFYLIYFILKNYSNKIN